MSEEEMARELVEKLMSQVNTSTGPWHGIGDLFIFIGLCVTIGFIGLWALRNLWRMLRGD